MKIRRLIMLIPFTMAASAGARAATLTVCASGCEHTTIQGAISHSVDGDVISIGKGHYFETVDTQGKALTLEGIDARQVVVDGNGIGSVITVSGLLPVTISNLTITRGYGELNSPDGRVGSYGGGISVTGSAALTLINSNIISNYSTFEGAGVYSRVGNLTIVGCTIADNESVNSGGGIYTLAPTISIDNSTIARNIGGGILVDSYYPPTFTQSVTVNKTSIVDNSHGGGILGIELQLSVQNSTIAGNSTDGNGGAISNSAGSTKLENVVITRNTAAGQGGGIYADATSIVGSPIPPHIVFQNTYVVLNSAGVDGGGTYIQGIVTNDGVDVAGNLPDNCGKGTVCP